LVRVLKADLDGLASAADAVAKGGVICYPTDTVYGLGCDPLNSSAIKRTMDVKRDRTKPMPVLVKGLADAENLAYITDRARRIAESFWPGPLTMILSSRKIVPTILTPERRVGVRSPRHPICLDLLGLCSGALIGTSANLSGRPSATTALEVLKELGNRVDVILDGGRTPLGVASTVVDLTQPKVAILREGPVERSEIIRCLRERKLR
jgi:L-threonylcarbamoyladenylate synthase